MVFLSSIQMHPITVPRFTHYRLKLVRPQFVPSRLSSASKSGYPRLKKKEKPLIAKGFRISYLVEVIGIEPTASRVRF